RGRASPNGTFRSSLDGHMRHWRIAVTDRVMVVFVLEAHGLFIGLVIRPLCAGGGKPLSPPLARASPRGWRRLPHPGDFAERVDSRRPAPANVIGASRGENRGRGVAEGFK